VQGTISVTMSAAAQLQVERIAQRHCHAGRCPARGPAPSPSQPLDPLFQRARWTSRNFFWIRIGIIAGFGVHDQADRRRALVMARAGWRPYRPGRRKQGCGQPASRQSAGSPMAPASQRSLDDTLRPDVFPGRRRVLREHGQVFVLQVVEDGPGGLHDVGVGHGPRAAPGVGVRIEESYSMPDCITSVSSFAR